jgi:hypothetical protein
MTIQLAAKVELNPEPLLLDFIGYPYSMPAAISSLPCDAAAEILVRACYRVEHE